MPWNGSDLDDRHHTFANRHPEAVRSYQLGNEHESKTALLSLFRRVLKDTAPVHVIDTRAQADALIMARIGGIAGARHLRRTGRAADIFPVSHRRHREHDQRGQSYFSTRGDRVDYVIVHNPAKARGDLFKGSQLEKQLLEYGAKAVTLPMPSRRPHCWRRKRPRPSPNAV